VAELRALRTGPPILAPELDDLVAMQLADLHMDAAEYAAARTLYDEAVRRRPANHFAWRQLYRLAQLAEDRDEVAHLRDELRARGVALPPPP
jgi:Tfp pilus assembly protein PilF